jgi:DNA-binding transcriptional MerR regulator
MVGRPSNFANASEADVTTPVMTIAILARQVGLSEKRVRQLADMGVVPCSRDDRGYRVFDHGAVILLKARAKKTQAEKQALLNRKAALAK